MSIIGRCLKNIPWQEKPLGYEGVIWRHEGNPIIDWNPTPKTARAYNSSVVTWGSGFIGIFRADHRDGKAQIHIGNSDDGIKWKIEDEPIQWYDQAGKLYQPDYSYDPRVVEIEGTYYIIWC
ncbi:MAG: glycoside hydrolase family 130 protein, partial [Ruminiclostridium sp.]